jgi:hypothetical protein
MNSLYRIQLLICLISSGSFCYSQPDTIPESADTISIEYFDVFRKVDPYIPEPPLVLYIEMNFKEFFKVKYQDMSVPANLSVYLEDSILCTKHIKIKPRGEFRKNHCIFPPFEIKFAKSDTDHIFTPEINKLKLVTHCKSPTIYEQYVLKEYLCYKMYNLLTDYSFRVRLLEIHYIDNTGKKKPIIRYGFIVESNKSLANRIDAYPVKLKGIFLNQTDYEIANTMAVFQYMIGNTDWAVPNLHNVKLYKLKDPSKFEPLPVPFDFDYSGMVNTDYAIPDERLDIKSVRQRVYRGFCIPEEDLMEIVELYKQRKASFYTLVHNFELLDKYQKTEMVKYLDQFYEIIENPNLIRSEIIKKCKLE